MRIYKEDGWVWFVGRIEHVAESVIEFYKNRGDIVYTNEDGQVVIVPMTNESKSFIEDVKLFLFGKND
jgi:hypothetical protein